MLPLLLIAACLLGHVITHPQNIDIKDITKSAPPEEVNAIQGALDIPSGINNSIETQNIEDTIKEVEDLIKSNPELPRLTRGEILDILENLTRQDNNLVSTLSNESHRDAKSLMVVKAYTPAGSGQVNIEELYTKQPITSIVDDENEPPHAEHLEGTAKTSTAPSITSTVSNGAVSRIEFHKKHQKLPENNVKKNIERKKPFRESVQIKRPLSNNVSTERPSIPVTRSSTPRTDLKKRRRPHSSTTETPPGGTTYSRKPVAANLELKHRNHKYPDEYPNKSPVYIPEHVKPVTPPSIAPTDINSELEDLIPQEGELHSSVVPNPYTAPNKNSLNSLSEPSIEIEIPEHLKSVVANLNLAAIQDVNAATTSNPTANKETENIQNVLASIGLYPVESSSTTTEIPNAQVMAGSLSEDMQNLLKSFGLLPDPNKNNKVNDETPSFNPEKAEISPEAYVGFKPLPEDTESRKEMESLLTQFGLLEKKPKRPIRTGREYSSKNTNTNLQLHEINLDIVPDDLKPVLHEMGFESGPRAGRKIREKPHSHNTPEYQAKDDTSTKQQHVSSPVSSEYVSDEEVQKLGKLLDIVKSLADKNGTITEEDMKKIDPKELNELIASLNVPTEEVVPLNQQIAPNPVEYDLGLSKNDIKRQEASTEASTTTASTTEESRTPSIKDLEDSFGGQSETVTETPEPPSTTPQNGFYYLLDWNSFFEIDDQKGKRVNLRFQPHVGDPKRFLSVSVP